MASFWHHLTPGGKIALSLIGLAAFFYAIFALLPVILAARPIIVLCVGIFFGAFLCKVKPVGHIIGIILFSIAEIIYGKRRR